MIFPSFCHGKNPFLFFSGLNDKIFLIFKKCRNMKEHQKVLANAIFQKFLISMVVYEKSIIFPTNILNHSSQSSEDFMEIYMSQLLRVDPSALASSPPAIGWRPASRGRPGATRDGCDLYTFILWVGSTRRDREGGSCSVLYSDPLRAIGTPAPEEMRNGASHYGGSPLILLNKEFASGHQGARRVTWTAARKWK